MWQNSKILSPGLSEKNVLLLSSCLTLWASTPQNGQTHSLPSNCLSVFDKFWGLALKRLIMVQVSKYCPIFVLLWLQKETHFQNMNHQPMPKVLPNITLIPKTNMEYSSYIELLNLEILRNLIALYSSPLNKKKSEVVEGTCWKLMETRTSYGQKLFYADNPGQIIWNKVRT